MNEMFSLDLRYNCLFESDDLVMNTNNSFYNVVCEYEGPSFLDSSSHCFDIDLDSNSYSESEFVDYSSTNFQSLPSYCPVLSDLIVPSTSTLSSPLESPVTSTPLTSTPLPTSTLPTSTPPIYLDSKIIKVKNFSIT
jgi:hypothetical protein